MSLRWSEVKLQGIMSKHRSSILAEEVIHMLACPFHKDSGQITGPKDVLQTGLGLGMLISNGFSTFT